MVITNAIDELFIFAIDARADRSWLSEIERGTGNRYQFAGWYPGRVDRGKAVSVDH